MYVCLLLSVCISFLIAQWSQVVRAWTWSWDLSTGSTLYWLAPQVNQKIHPPTHQKNTQNTKKQTCVGFLNDDKCRIIASMQKDCFADEINHYV